MRIFAAILAAAAVFLVVQGGIAFFSSTPRPQKEKKPKAPGRPSLETQLRQAGLAITPWQFRGSVAMAAVVTFAAVYAITETASVSMVPAVAVGWGPRVFYQRRRTKILKQRVAAWPEAVRDVLTHLAVGRTVHQALVELGTSGPEELRDVWVTYARNAAVLDVPTALEQARADLADPVSDHVIEAFEAAHDRGSAVAVAVLDAVAEQVTRDLMMHEEIETAQTETRAQAVFAAILPFVVLVMLVTSSEGFARFYSRPIGWIVIGVGVAMASIGWKIITALGKVPEEPRILARRIP